MPLISAATEIGIISRLGAVPVLRATRSATGMKMATTPVELMKAPSPATAAISRTSSRVSLLPVLAMSQSPSRCATPVRTRPLPTTKRAASRTTFGSLKPARVSATPMTPVRGSAVSMISPTASMRGLLIANIAIAAASKPSTSARLAFIGSGWAAACARRDRWNRAARPGHRRWPLQCQRAAKQAPATWHAGLSSRRARSAGHDLHRDLHPIERIRRSRPGAGERRRLLLLAGDGDRDVLGAGALVVGRIEAVPARPGEIHLRPGVGGAVLSLAHLDVPGDEARAEAPVARGFHHEHRVVPAGSTAELERLVRQLHAGVVARNVTERLVDVRVQRVQQVEGVDDLAGTVQIGEPLLEGRAVVRVAGKSERHELDLLDRGILERERSRGGVDEALDGIVVVEAHVRFTEDAQHRCRLAERDDRDRVAVDVAQPADGGFGLDLDTSA